MEVHKVNIAIVITANASTGMVPPDMVIVTKCQPKNHIAGRNGIEVKKIHFWSSSAIIIFSWKINTQSSITSWKTFFITHFSFLFYGQIWPNISLVYGGFQV